MKRLDVIALAFSAALAATTHGQTTIQLAGHALPEFPYFQYVASIGEDRPVEVAIDPTRFPKIADASADLYIVTAKTTEAWAADPSLTDARGSAQPVTFQAGTIQRNTFIAAAVGVLESRPPLGLGVGYDVILDMDRDGELGPEDYIDGLGDDAGFYMVHDTTLPGPFDVSVVEYSGGQWLGQRTHYPTAIASMGQLPLVAIGHGWTHTYGYYDHIGTHLASYGYVVMAFTNDVGFGGSAATNTASITTIENTDYILGNQATIAGGVLNGHIDAHRIVWMGHSTGGEAVVRGYKRLLGGWPTEHYDWSDITLISSICPVAFQSRTNVHPENVNYHMFVSGADTDTSGAPIDGYVQNLAIYERANGAKQVTYVHGAGHNDFHTGDQNPFAAGPDLIGKEATNTLVKGYYLPLVELYARDNPAGKDFFSRMYDDFRPIGIPDNVTIANDYRDAKNAGNFVIDDYETQPNLDVSSSGGAVTGDVIALAEVRMHDQDGQFTWTGFQSSNGMTRARFADDEPRCAVFRWHPDTPRSYELEIIPRERDLTDDEYLSFRACQGTRHPNTVGLNGPLTFTVTLRDDAGVTSSIQTGNYGGITRPYQRTGFGAGAGWQNEFSTIRIRLTDFLNNGSGLDLSDVVAVRFDFGTGFGSERGFIGLDDVQVTRVASRASRIDLCFPDGLPHVLVPNEPTVIPVRIVAHGESYVGGSGAMRYRYGGETYQTAPLVPVEDDLYTVTLPHALCGETAEFWFAAEGDATGVVTEPAGAPASAYTAVAAEPITVLDEPLDTDPAWARDGQWAFGPPTGQGGAGAGSPDPTAGFTGDNVFGINLDGDYVTTQDGPQRMTLGPIDLTGVRDTYVRFRRWLNCESQSYVDCTVEVSNDGVTWEHGWAQWNAHPFPGASVFDESSWALLHLDISHVAADEANVWIRWGHEITAATVPMSGWNVDDIVVGGYTICCGGDLTDDGTVGFDDLLVILSSWGPCPRCPEDINGDGAVAFDDLLELLSAWGPCP